MLNIQFVTLFVTARLRMLLHNSGTKTPQPRPSDLQGKYQPYFLCMLSGSGLHLQRYFHDLASVYCLPRMRPSLPRVKTMFKSSISTDCAHHIETLKMFSSQADRNLENTFEDTNGSWIKLAFLLLRNVQVTQCRGHKQGYLSAIFKNSEGHLTKVTAVLRVFLIYL